MTAQRSSEDEELRFRERVLRGGYWIGVSFGVLSAASYGLDGAWGQVVLNLFMAGALGLLLALRRGGLGVRPALHLGMGVLTVSLALSTVAQNPPDPSNAMFLLLVPLFTTLVGSPREGWAWFGITLVLGVVATWLAALGVHLDSPAPGKVEAAILNYAILLVAVMAVIHRFSTERRRSFARLVEVNRSKSVFLANVGHEIRTPMNGVLGMTEALLAQELPAAQREMLETVQRSGVLMVALLNDLLELSKGEAGKLKLDPGPVSLRSLVQDLALLYGAQAQKKGLSLAIEVDQAVPPVVLADALRLRQVLGNLLSNALKFTSEGGVALRVASLGAAGAQWRLRFEVEDSGIGIEPSVLPRLFHAFEQADSTTTRRFGGTGLGLALSQQLVELMGGTVEVRSAAGKGSRFAFTLSLDPAPGGRVELAPAPPEVQEPVLVVDDNAINLKVAVALLQADGYQVDVAHDGAQAIAAVTARPYAVVLMDLHMPVMDGLEATAHIRALPSEAAHVPIIALTASALSEDVEVCRKVGMHEYLAKPLNQAALRQAMGRALASRRRKVG